MNDEQVELQKLREEKRTLQKWNYFTGGFFLGLSLLGILVAYLWFVAKPTVDNVVTTITAQRDACQARFTRSTILMDTAGGHTQRVHLLHGLVDLAPGAAIGGDQAKPAWLIPADVEPIFYGDAASAVVMKFDDKGQLVSSQIPNVVAGGGAVAIQ